MNLFTVLYRHLILYRTATIPGIGEFILPNTDNGTFRENKDFYTNGQQIKFIQNKTIPPKTYYHTLSGWLNISYTQTLLQLDDLAQTIKTKIKNNEPVFWKGVGYIQINEDGNIILTDKISTKKIEEKPKVEEVTIVAETPIVAFKNKNEKSNINDDNIIVEDSNEIVTPIFENSTIEDRNFEMETPIIATPTIEPTPLEIIEEKQQRKKMQQSREIASLLLPQIKKTNNWWTYSLAILILLAAFFIWYFNEHPFSPNSFGNQQSVLP